MLENRDYNAEDSNLIPIGESELYERADNAMIEIGENEESVPGKKSHTDLNTEDKAKISHRGNFIPNVIVPDPSKDPAKIRGFDS